MIAPAASSLRRAALTAIALAVLAGCTDVIEFDNPFDPESPASPLGFGVSVIEFSVAPDPSGLRAAFLQWEDVPGAVQYEVEIFGTDPDLPLFTTATSTPQIGPVQIDSSSRYDARVRYEAQFEYLGEVRSAWSPWRAAGTVAFDADGVPANLAVESYTVPVTSETEGQLVITFTVPGWNGDPRIFARIEPDPFNTDQIEILPNELTFFLPVAWGEIYDVIAFDEQGRERTILTFDLGAFEDINPLVSSLSFPDPVVQNAVDSVSAPETRVSDITFLTIGSGATSLAGLERFLWLQGLFLDDSSVTDLSPIANVWELQTLSPKYADQRYCADWGDAISWVSQS
jgi:hypothetical protein